MDALQVINGIGTFISVAKPILENVAPKLQDSMKGVAERLLVLAEKYPSLAELSTVIDKAADYLGDILFVLGVKSESADVLGVKASMAEKGVEEFETIEEYINYLRDEIEIDKQKYDSLSSEEREAYSVVGLSIETGAIAEKIGINISADAVELLGQILEARKIVIEVKDLITIMNYIREEGINDLDDVCDLFKGSGDSDRIKTREMLSKALDEIHPADSDVIINDIMDIVRE